MVVGGVALSAASLGAYFVFHRRARASRAYLYQTLNPKEGHQAVAAAERAALIRRFPIYPETDFGIHYPVTSLAVADVIWRAWFDKTSAHRDARDHLVSTLQVISDEIADRAGNPSLSPNWHVLLQSSIMLPTSLQIYFAGKIPGGDFLAYLEAQQFWTTIMTVALMLDAHEAWDPSFWTYVWEGVRDEIEDMPSSFGDYVSDITRWLTELGASVLAGAAGGFLAGLFSSFTTPLLVTGGALVGGYVLYEKLD